MKKVFLVLPLLFAAIGCADVAPVDAPLVPEAVAPEVCTDEPGLGNGAPCNGPGQCASYTCVESPDGSYCYDWASAGCREVVQPYAVCVGTIRLCGALSNPVGFGTCEPIWLGTSGETYFCCTGAGT